MGLNKKAYIITFDKGVLDRIDYLDFHNKLISATGVDSWWHYLEGTYIIIVDTAITAKNVGDFILNLWPSKLFLVTEITPENYYGRLNKDAWTWLEKVKDIVN